MIANIEEVSAVEKPRPARCAAISMLALLAVLGGASARADEPSTPFFDMSLEELMNQPVTTVSRSAQSIYDVSAPIYVITAEDIRRSGASSIPEALRLAPGIAVEQIDPGRWVVSLRGFAWQYANKALILLDGREVYTSLNSAVYWDSLDVPMEDVERIEVIRGPGDARWGSHAVNGIINIITRTAASVRGISASTTFDTEDGRILTVREGGPISSQLDYRTYAKYLSQGDFKTAGGSPVGGRDALRAGARFDGTTPGGNQWTFITDTQRTRDSAILPAYGFMPVHYDVTEISAIGRWERESSSALKQHAQLSLDHTNQELYEARTTLDLTYQAQLPQFFAQNWTFGLTYKHSSDRLPANIAIVPDSMDQDTYGLFAHDRIQLSARTQLLLGSQFEHNRFTGWEAQPDIQLLYSPNDRSTVWTSVSRAVRTPLRTENGFDLQYPLFPGAYGVLLGNHDLKAEDVLAWQSGARWTVRSDLLLDVTAFYNHYDNVILEVAGTPFFQPLPFPGSLVFPSIYSNAISGWTRGVEGALKARPIPRWTVALSYSLYSQTPWHDPLGFGYLTGIGHQFQLHSGLDLGRNLEWNTDFYYTGPLSTGDVPGFYKLDAQLSWKPWQELRLAVGIKNALSPLHREAGINSVDAATEIPRAGYLQVSWRL